MAKDLTKLTPSELAYYKFWIGFKEYCEGKKITFEFPNTLSHQFFLSTKKIKDTNLKIDFCANLKASELNKFATRTEIYFKGTQKEKDIIKEQYNRIIKFIDNIKDELSEYKVEYRNDEKNVSCKIYVGTNMAIYKQNNPNDLYEFYFTSVDRLINVIKHYI